MTTAMVMAVIVEISCVSGAFHPSSHLINTQNIPWEGSIIIPLVGEPEAPKGHSGLAKITTEPAFKPRSPAMVSPWRWVA